MSKIVQAINAMISHPHLITEVTRNGTELFFLYNGKHKWSMALRDNGTWLWYYPGNDSLEDLANQDWEDIEHIPMVTYRDTEIGTKEAKASFSELFSILKEKVYGMDRVFEDIIGTDEDDDLPF